MKPVAQVLMLKTEAAEHYCLWTALSQTALFLQVLCKAVTEDKTPGILRSEFEEFGTWTHLVFPDVCMPFQLAFVRP